MTQACAGEGGGGARPDGRGLGPWLSRRRGRGLALLMAVVLAVGMGRFLWAMIATHGGLIYGDSFTYVTYARSLAGGSLFYMDGPVGEMVAAAERPAQRYWEPIWNHAVRPDGRTVSSMAIGYPLLLAAALKAGGIWWLYHLNLFLVAGFLLVLMWLVWEGLGRNGPAARTALVTGLLLPRVVPQAIQQFTYPWREPYFFILVLGATGCLLRFARSGKGGWLAALALLSGMACAVKEVNAVYGLVLGVAVVSLRAYRRHPRVLALTLACAALFCAGVAPLLVQNALGTGNPLVSFQMLRETAQYSLAAPGAGLSLGNAGTTLSRYVRMYAENPLYQAWFLALAGLGAAAALRHLLGRILLGLAAVHFALYTQWGNADLRQSYFFNVPYAFCLVLGLFAVLGAGARLAGERGRRWLPWAQLAAAGVLAVAPLPRGWRLDPAAAASCRYADARRFAADLDARLPEEALLLVNRSVRDMLGTFSERHFIRLSELNGLRADHDVHPLIAPLVEDGRLFFLDNVDQDPHYLFRANRTVIDRELLLDRYRLVRVAEWDGREYKLAGMLDAPVLTLWQVVPWEAGPGRRELPVPAAGAVFLFADRRAAASNLVVTLNGRPVPLPEDGGYYCPVADWPLGALAVVEWSLPGGGPVPPMADLKLLGWDDLLTVSFGMDAVPADAPHFPGELGPEQIHAPWRLLKSSFALQLPVFARPGVFWACRLDATGNQEAFAVEGPDRRPREMRCRRNAAWLVLTESELGAEAGPVAANARFAFRLPEQAIVKLKQAQLMACFRRLEFAPAANSRGVAWGGLLVPDAMTAADRPWTMRLDGRPAAAGQALPWADLNLFWHCAAFPEQGGGVAFEFSGAGMTQVESVQIGESVQVDLAGPTRFLLDPDTTYRVERNEKGELFCWTRGMLRVGVPLTPGASAYELELDARDGHPEQPRGKLEVVFGDARAEAVPGPTRQSWAWTLPAPADNRGMGVVEFRIEPWSPCAVLQTADKRELGFQFHRLEWRPVK